jgi:hypothetical protein
MEEHSIENEGHNIDMKITVFRDGWGGACALVQPSVRAHVTSQDTASSHLPQGKTQILPNSDMDLEAKTRSLQFWSTCIQEQ